ncbi:MAG TPA: autotransporter-associated beta strand repeat-containing protein [Verrucomicrobiae bacterium]|nr:autotransporter-associated beta strand repeat-containing protein [Verrucomicrobiae bacterium]
MAVLMLLLGVGVASAGNVSLRTSDAANTSSFNGSTNWNPVGAASAGNAYFTGAFTIRTTNATTTGLTFPFAGDSLSIDAGGRLLGKIGNNAANNTAVGTIQVPNLILNGGSLDQAGANSDNSVLIVAGNVTVNTASFLGALGSTANNNAKFETVEFTAPISGSAALQVSGPGINGGQDTGNIKLSAANPYSGTITVSNGVNNAIASAVNRILQLNNLNALSNATLNLNAAQANPVSFASGVNTDTFNLGGLAGRSPQTLMDTASTPVTLSVGANNSNTTYSGPLTDSGSLTKVGTGTLTLTGTNTYAGATTISSGALQLGNGGVGGSLPAGSTLTVNGSLIVNRNNTATQGTDFTSTPITGTGSFTQAGSGTTILNVANSYSGVTLVNAGTLVVSSTQTGAGAVTVADGARLRVTVAGANQLSPSALTLGTSSTSFLEFDGLNSTTLAPINAGTFSAGGSVAINITSGTFAAGNNYPLVSWTTSGPADASSFALGSSPGLTATLSVSGSTLFLNVSGVSDVWTGIQSGNWDTATANWGGHSSIFANGDAVLFSDSANNPFVTVSAAVQPGSTLFNNSVAVAYTITSSGADNIGGSGGLTKNNSGTVTLSGGANTYTGVTAVNGGTVSVGALANGGSPSDIGAASSDSANLALNNSTLQYTGGPASIDRGATLGASGATLEIDSAGIALADTGAIVGSGSLTKTGPGALALFGANTFSGGMALNSGELDINNGGSSSANSAIGTGTLNIGAGTIIDNTSGGDVTLLPNNAQVWGSSFIFGGFGNNLNLGAGPVSLPAISTLNIFANTLTAGGLISGAGGLVKLGAGTLVLSSANTFSGGVNLTQGTVAIGNDLALGTGQLDFNGGAGGATFQSVDGTAHTITNAINFDGGAGATTIFGGTGNLKFTGSAANGTSKIMTVNNPQTEFSGVLSGAMARTVAGTGTLILSGTNTYSLGTTISFGSTLQLGNGGLSGSLSASGAIDNEGTLIFNRSNGVVQGIDFASAPIFGGGSVVQNGYGTITLNAANTYFGATLVNHGELFITPAYANGGDVTVADGASFGVSASSVSNSATIGNLTLGNGGQTTLDFSYGLTGNPTNAPLFANTVTINGTSSIRIGGTFVVGTFPVLKYGSLSGAFNSTVTGPRGVSATLFNDTGTQTIYVTVSAVGSGILWTGTSSLAPNLWDLNTTTNWLIGGLPTDYIENVPPGDAVTFNDSGSGTVLLSNTVSPASVTINNSSVNYTFQGNGQINSPGGLTKIGGSTLTLNVPGTFTGNTVISNGTLSVGANQTFGNLSGDSSVNVSTGAPTITVNESSNTTYAGNLSGALGLTKMGSSVLTMTGSNNFSGNVFVSLGMLTLDSGSINSSAFASIGHVGSDNGTLTLKGTASFATTSDFNAGDVGAAVGTLNIQDTASLIANAFYVGSANSAGSTASGTVNQTGGTVTEQNTTAGTFCIGGRATTTSVGGIGTYNLSAGTLNAASAIRVGAVGTGTFEQSGGTVIANAGVDIATAPGAVGTYNLDGGTLMTLNLVCSSTVNSTVNFNGGLLMPLANSAAFMTNITQAYVRNGGLVIDTANFIVTMASPLQHSLVFGDNALDGGLTKHGNGTLNVTGLGSSYTGPTSITGGTANFAPGSIANLNNVTVNNATLGVGLAGGTTTFAATGLTLMGNSMLNFNYDLVSGTPVTAIASSGGLNISGTTVINVYGYGLSVGQFPLVSYTGTPLANLGNIVLSALPYGVTASLSNNVDNLSIDLVVTDASIATWIPLTGTDPTGTSGFATAGTWQDGNPPTPGNGYFTRTFAVRSPADSSAYTFAGSVLSIDTGGRFIMKGTNGQVLTVPNLIINGGLVDYANGADNFVETLNGNITLQKNLVNYMGALGSAGLSETFYVNSVISGVGDLQLGGATVNNGTDVGVVVFSGNNTYTGATALASGTLLVNGSNGNSPITVGTNATLGGTGSIGGTITVQAGGRLAPGTPTRGALTNAIGTLTATGAVSVSGTVAMKIDRNASPTSDKFVASSVTVNSGATLTVANIGSTNLMAGDTFTLFSAPISGAFSTVTLPALPTPDLSWTNRLAIDGSIAVIGGTTTVNPNSTNITASVSGGTLTLSWPQDHTGWTLQAQTNAPGVGIGTAWSDVIGSASTNVVSLPISITNGSVFYRLKLSQP